MSLAKKISELQKLEGQALGKLDAAASVYRKRFGLTRGEAMSRAIVSDPASYTSAVDYGIRWRQLARSSGVDLGWAGQA